MWSWSSCSLSRRRALSWAFFTVSTTRASTREAVAGIVHNNLYGLDIDDRAAQLAYFAVMMKARQYDRRFFSRRIQPNVYAIQESSEIQLKIALPFEGHDTDWEDRSRSRMSFLIRHSAETVIVGNKEAPPAVNYRRRNEYMVDRAGYLLAVYDNDRSIRSGTGMTVNYARKKGLPITLIHPDKATISKEKPER